MNEIDVHSIGIDIGVYGAVVSCHTRVRLQCSEKSEHWRDTFNILGMTIWTMPTRQSMIGKRKKKALDVSALAGILRSVAETDVVAVESVHAFPSQGVVSMFSFGFQYGAVMGILEAFGNNIILFDAREWRSFFFGNQKGKNKRDRKQESVNFVSGVLNIEIDGFRGRYKDGVADAILISLYGAYRHAESFLFSRAAIKE